MPNNWSKSLIAVPLLAAQEDAIFHGDPHAGNLLYNSRSGELTIIDWALSERLSRDQRRHLALLFLMVSLRDPVGTCNEVSGAQLSRTSEGNRQGADGWEMVAALYRRTAGDASCERRRCDETPGARCDEGYQVSRTVDYVVESDVYTGWDPGRRRRIRQRMGFTIARHVAQHWIKNRKEFRSPLMAKDWITLQCSALLYTSRLWLQSEQAI